VQVPRLLRFDVSTSQRLASPGIRSNAFEAVRSPVIRFASSTAAVPAASSLMLMFRFFSAIPLPPIVRMILPSF